MLRSISIYNGTWKYEVLQTQLLRQVNAWLPPVLPEDRLNRNIQRRVKLSSTVCTMTFKLEPEWHITTTESSEIKMQNQSSN